MQPENKLQIAIRDALRAGGYPAWRIRLLGIAGFPDIYAIGAGGRAIHIEVKIPGKKLRKKQEWFLRILAKAGAVAGVATTASEALDIAERSRDG